MFCNALTSQDKRLRLKQADILINRTINGAATQLLSGNVIFTKESTTLTSDRARWRDKIKEGTLAGNVVITKEDMTLTCDSLYYDSNRDLMKTFGRTRIKDDDYDLETDSLIFYSEIDSGDAMGNVRLLQKTQDITADRMTYVKKPNNDAVSYTATGDVIILETEEDRKATCGQAIYNRDEETTILIEDPKLFDGKRELTGDRIELFYSNEVLQYMHIPSRSHVVSIADGWREMTMNDSIQHRLPVMYQDEMDGNTMRGFFLEGELDSLRLEGMATTLYHIFEDSVYEGKNSASGDTIIMRFGESELEDIFIMGGARGTYTPDTTSEDLSGNIVYNSNNILYDVQDESTILEYDARIQHEATDLTAGYITVDWNTNLLYALPVADGDTITPPILPTLVEKGDEPMVGTSMVYNLKTQKGRIRSGRTKVDDGYYAGQTIRNQGRKTFYIRNSLYTSCELENPHFHFAGERMKMIHKDKIISRPMIFQISHIPIIGLPFIILPHQGGKRHSGWIMPTYGDNKNRGQYLDGGGYFYAPNEYVDSKFIIGFADKQGIRLRNILRYKKRYAFSGSLHLEGKWLLNGTNDIASIRDNYNQDIVFKWTHNQTLRHRQTFKADVKYYSNGAYNYQTGTDISERLNQKATSNIHYSKGWKNGLSFSISANANQDLMAIHKIDSTSVFYVEPKKKDQELTIISGNLPNATFNVGSRNPFKLGSSQRWYNNISTSYRVSLNRSVRTFYKSEEYNDTDSTTSYRWIRDSDGEGLVHNETENSTITHGYSIASPFKIFRYISLNPRISLTTHWYDRYFSANLDSTNNSVVRVEELGFASRTTGSMSMSMNTNIYGLFPIRIGAFGPVRHTITPSIGYSYRPDFSKPFFGHDFGYFETISDTAGNPLIYDRFRGTPQNESKSMTMSLRNIFETKWGEEGNEKRVKLLNWNMNTRYNFAAEEFHLANLSSSFSSRIGNILNIRVSMTHDFYEFDTENKERLPSFRTSRIPMDNGRYVYLPQPRLINASFNTGFSFSGKRWSPILQDSEPDTVAIDTTQSADEDMFQGDLSSRAQRISRMSGGQLWRASFTVNYSLNKSNPDNEIKNFWLSANSSFNITKTWKLAYTARFNMIDTELISSRFSIEKDLHCWELSFNWTPTGPGAGYYLKINVKSPNLRDIKIEEKGGVHRTRYGF